MDMAQFEMLISLLREAGQGTFTLALVFLLFPYFKTVAAVSCAALFFRMILRIVRSCSFTNEVKAAAGIRGELETSTKQLILDRVQGLFG
jgi:hypothetical protein